jgi:hypothetical protein
LVREQRCGKVSDAYCILAEYNVAIWTSQLSLYIVLVAPTVNYNDQRPQYHENPQDWNRHLRLCDREKQLYPNNYSRIIVTATQGRIIEKSYFCTN